MVSKYEDLCKKSGEVLRMALHIESTLDFFIANYFSLAINYRTNLLRDVLSDINFGRKIGMFEQICRDEQLDETKLQEILTAIRFVTDIRNKVAHWEAFLEDPGLGNIKLWTRKSTKYKEDQVDLTEELLKKIDEQRALAIKGTYEFDRILSDPKREPPVKIF
jgi:hypothetical protein